jgi:iduronate 2-sulfatase
MLALTALAALTTASAHLNANNVLFIVVDNLRPAIGAYGDSTVLTPRMDMLAKESTLFSRAYCQEAWCAPSRNSFLTGRRPDTTQAWNFRDSFRTKDDGSPGAGANWTTLPGYFKQHGFYTTSSGKIFHDGLPAGLDYPASWSDVPIMQDKYDCLPKGRPANATLMACELPPSASDADVECADLAIFRLRAWRHHGGDEPFFLAVGFQSPRLPWSYPAASAAKYPPSSELPITKRQEAVESSTEWFRPTEIAWYADVRTQGGITHPFPMEASLQRAVRRGYYAAITHVDTQVGRLLDELDTLRVSDTTAVVLTADHAQNLGESNMWSMMNLLETSTRVPLLIRPAPKDARFRSEHGIRRVHGEVVELVDLFPTMSSLASLPAPPAEWHLPGKDRTGEMLRVPKAAAGAAVEGSAAFSQITRCLNCTAAYKNTPGYQQGCGFDSADARDGYMVPCAKTERNAFTYMGMSIRMRDWRYSVYCRWDGAALRADWSHCTMPELFNHTADVALYDVEQNGEYSNLAGHPATQAIQRGLHAKLQAAFSGTTL